MAIAAQGRGLQLLNPPAQARGASGRALRPWAVRLVITDWVVIYAAVTIALVLRFGVSTDKTTNGPISVSYGVLGLALTLVWLAILGLYRARDFRILGEGPEEYQRIIQATLITFGVLGTFSLAFKVDMSRGYLAVAFPLGLLGLLASRIIWRRKLRAARSSGKLSTSVLLIGSIRSANEIARWFEHHHRAGLHVHAVWVPDGDIDDGQVMATGGRSVPVLGKGAELDDALAASDAQLVIVTDTDHLGHQGLKQLTWDLEEVRVDLMISPNVVDVSGSRIALSTVASMPFLSVSEPQYAAASTWRKVMFDRLASGLLVLAALPVLAVTAIAVKMSGPGPVIYRQQRVGKDGLPFDMIKFRSMKTNADAELRDLLEEAGVDNGRLPKLKDDPRVTPIGRFIRRYSIDELPQLLNVIRGEMSLVGPRPQRDFEVAQYDQIAHRRLRVRPGMTGLWQVSGRSDLSWDDAVRLDTYYVENWSMIADVAILWRTARAVIGRDGAY
jgi:exopolysaccharide biosynthesis polyprenyl glycosylphosphotransferase